MANRRAQTRDASGSQWRRPRRLFQVGLAACLVLATRSLSGSEAFLGACRAFGHLLRGGPAAAPRCRALGSVERVGAAAAAAGGGGADEVTGALLREVERRRAVGSREARELDDLAIAPQRARPSPLLAPDRVVEHVLYSLATLPADDAADQAFLFSAPGAEAEPAGGLAVLRRTWVPEGKRLLDRESFGGMLVDSYGPLLGRAWQPLRHLSHPAWSADDRRVSFLVAAGHDVGAAASVTLRRPGLGSHRDCWLVDSVALRALPGAEGAGGGGAEAEEQQHNEYQESTFDDKADYFASPGATPPAVVPRLRRVARACRLGPGTSLLDAATGTGALLPFYEEEGAVLSRVTGVDLSEGMMTFARQRFPAATFVKSDILNFVDTGGRRFDRVVFNACFGNFWDQGLVLKHVASALVAPGGLVVLSHPLGRRWLEGLQKRDPRMVRHFMPSADTLARLLDTYAPSLSLVSVDDEEDYYCAVLQQLPLDAS